MDGASQEQGGVIIQCVKIGGKLRLRIKTSSLPLNRQINCSGSKAIRKENALYKFIGRISLISNKNTLYYKLSNNPSDYIFISEQQEEIKEEDLPKLNIQVYKELDCCICFTSQSSIIFIPCGHQVVCQECWQNMQMANKHTTNKCPFCRQCIIQSIYKKDIEI